MADRVGATNKESTNMQQHLTFNHVVLEIFRRMMLRTKIAFIGVWVILGSAVYMAVCAWHIAHATGGVVPALVLVCLSIAFIGAAAQNWNAYVMPPVYRYLWRQAAERGVADQYAVAIRLQIGEGMGETAQTRGFVNLVRAYCAASNG